MTTTWRYTDSTRVPMDRMRRTAFVAGALYLITFVTSIPALALYDDVLNNPDFVLGAGSEARVLWGALLEVILGLSCVGTAVALFPVVKRQHEGVALGFVTARLLEAAMIFVGILSLLAVVTLRQDLGSAAGGDAASLVNTGRSLVAIHDWTFLLGPGIIPGVNALCLGYLLYRSRLVPRILPVLGLVGAPILLASATATLFGLYDQVSSWAMIAALPIAVWELSLGVWLVVKGFKPSPVITDDVPTGRTPDAAPVPALA